MPQPESKRMLQLKVKRDPRITSTRMLKAISKRMLKAMSKRMPWTMLRMELQDMAIS
jgi:hypothetical protein